ncbi:MAG: anion transporter [Chloroflexi bacterium]|nr:anion transporter [Chloroflexota bacterium]
MVSVIVLFIVFLLIAVRHLGSIRLQIWQIMLLGAVAVLATGEISPQRALSAINADVMLFLFGVFIIGQALEDSGYLSYLSSRLFRRARSPDGLVLGILFGMGLLSALLMNDTLAIVGTPVVLALAGKNGIPPRLLLLALAFAVTTGSLMSPIGNPQNLLIALHGNVPNPFVTFLRSLLLPTLLNLLLAYVLLRLFYRRHFGGKIVPGAAAVVTDPRLAALCKVSLALMVTLITARIATVLLGMNIEFKLTYIALVSALPVLAFVPRRPGILKRMDWFTLVFFAAMFVLMQSAWDSGFFQGALDAVRLDPASVGVVLGVSVLLSQVISNVPMVALYLPVLAQAGASTTGMMALAAGSTIAGNLTILGAASNVIIIQQAERRQETLTFFEFARVGLPLTALNVLVYWLFLGVLPA